MRDRMKIVLISIFIVINMFFLKVTYAKEMVTISDMAGREVSIPKKVDRIVALSGSLRYIIYMQAFDKVIGIEGVERQAIMKGNPAVGKAYWNVIKDKVGNLPIIGEGGPGKLPDFEKLISVNPDLIITYEIDQAQLIQSKTKIPTLVIKEIGIENYRAEDIQSILLFLGRVLGKEKRAEELINYINKCIEDIEKRTKNVQGPKVYLGAISAKGPHGITSTKAFFTPLNWLRVQNVADKIGKQGHLFIDKEMLLSWNPDYIFIDTGGLNLVREDYIKYREFYKKLKAVRDGQVYTLFPLNFYRTNLEVSLLNTYFMGKVIYPERFKDIDFRNKAKEIFEKFLGIDVYEDIKSVFKGYGKVEFTDSGLIIH